MNFVVKTGLALLLALLLAACGGPSQNSIDAVYDRYNTMCAQHTEMTTILDDCQAILTPLGIESLPEEYPALLTSVDAQLNTYEELLDANLDSMTDEDIADLIAMFDNQVSALEAQLTVLRDNLTTLQTQTASSSQPTA